MKSPAESELRTQMLGESQGSGQNQHLDVTITGKQMRFSFPHTVIQSAAQERALEARV